MRELEREKVYDTILNNLALEAVKYKSHSEHGLFQARLIRTFQAIQRPVG